MKTKRMWAGAAAAVCMLVVAPAWGHPHPDERVLNLEEIIGGLEQGMVALEQLERERELEMLRGIAEEVRQNARVKRAANRLAGGQLEALRMAMEAFREKGHVEAIELTERAIRAREVHLEGRRDREARDIAQRGPRREQCIELMNLAVDLYRQFGAQDRAERLRRAIAELWPQRVRQRGRERERRGERDRPDDTGNRIEIMRMALRALLEADRRDAADLLERAEHALKMDAQRRRDDESMTIRNNAPSVGQQIELLQLASRLWREFGHPDRADTVGELAEQLAAESRRGRRPEQRRRERGDDEARRMEEVQEQIQRLENAIEELRHRLRDRERDR